MLRASNNPTLHGRAEAATAVLQTKETGWALRAAVACLFHTVTMSSSSHRSSTSSDQSFKSGRSRSPSLSAHDSTAALILIHDPENLDSPFEFSDEEEDYEPLDANHRSSTSVPSLSPSTAFVYLLSPYLSLGALLLPSASSSLKYGLGSLVLFAVLSAFVRQIWYMLGRYMRTLSMDEVVVDAFARGRGKEKRRRILRVLIRFGTGFLRVVLASMYLRGASVLILQ